jgi:glutamate racemase
MNKNNPIGLFDSGIGGTSIWNAINTLMPNENCIYLADSKNAPYGIKSKNEITALSIKNTMLLIEHGAKIIVVACNTATTNAIKELRAMFDIPFIGIEPAIKPAVQRSKTQKIGILATKGTLNSELFNKNIEYYNNTKIVEQVGYGLVELIESGAIHSAEMTQLLHSYLQPMIEEDIDYLVLGCSHYPYLIPQIREILPENVIIIDSGEAVARQTKHILEEKNILNNNLYQGKTIFYSNSATKVLKEMMGTQQEVVALDF